MDTSVTFEIYKSGDKWGWRLCGCNGSTVATSGATFNSSKCAALAVGCFKYAVGVAKVVNVGETQ